MVSPVYEKLMQFESFVKPALIALHPYYTLVTRTKIVPFTKNRNDMKFSYRVSEGRCTLRFLILIKDEILWFYLYTIKSIVQISSLL